MRTLMAVAVVLVGTGVAAQDPPKQDKDVDVDWTDPVDGMGNAGPEVGKDSFTRFCAPCHGDKGDGKGPLAEHLEPRPRNFTTGLFKCRSTPPETLPAKMDLMRAIVHGIPISGMLSYSFLQTEEQVAMMEHVKSLCVKEYEDNGKKVRINPFEREGHGKPLKSGNIPQPMLRKPTPEGIAKGRELYAKNACHECHGERGDGKGKKASELVDNDGQKIAVRDFTQGIYSGGPDIRHLYLRLSLGVQGTPMPSFASLSIEERWNLAEYVISLNQRKEKLPLPHSEVVRALLKKELPADPWAAVWDEIGAIPVKHPGPENYAAKSEYAALPLYFQQLRILPDRPYYLPASVRAVHDGKATAILLEWADAAASSGADGGPPDRVEVQWSMDQRFTFAVGGLEKEPVSLWRWTAKEPTKGIEVESFGPFKEKAQEEKSQNLKATGSWKGGKWRVLFRRDLKGAAGEASMDVGTAVPILFHLWDGNHKDDKFQRLVTTWHTVKFEEK